MAITKVSRNLLNTGVSDSSDATAITIDSDENIGFNTTGIAAGSTSSASNSTATPKKIVINNDYSNGATDASLKLYLYNSGSVRQGFTSGSNYDLQYHNSGHATGRHAFYVGNTESVRIDANGIKFNGDSAATNALDDYEEGLWTPTIASGGSVSSTSARYTKIGDTVRVTARLSSFSFTSVDGTHLAIGGLPYSMHSDSNVGFAWGDTGTQGKAVYFWSGSGGGSSAYAFWSGSNYDATTHNEVPSGFNLLINLVYGHG